MIGGRFNTIACLDFEMKQKQLVTWFHSSHGDSFLNIHCLALMSIELSHFVQKKNPIVTMGGMFNLKPKKWLLRSLWFRVCEDFPSFRAMRYKIL
jgi:hypothetical protein